MLVEILPVPAIDVEEQRVLVASGCSRLVLGNVRLRLSCFACF